MRLSAYLSQQVWAARGPLACLLWPLTLISRAWLALNAMAYAKARVQFGQPISDFQAIRFKIATMATEIEAARQLMYYVCSEIDAGRAGRVETSMVKLFASEMAERVTSEALQIFGGIGYMRALPYERIARDVRIFRIFEGTNEILRQMIGLTGLQTD